MNPIEQKLEAKIAEINAQHKKAAENEIEKYKLSFELDSAKKELLKKHSAEERTFIIK